MPKSYNAKIIDPETTVKACVSNAKVSFKNTRETCSTLRGRTLAECFSYFDRVLNKKDCVPMRRYCYGVGRTSQAKKYGFGKFTCDKGRWPEKSIQLMVKICKNIKNNALTKGLNPDDLVVQAVCVNKAPVIHSRCYRAYGRINAFNKSPCHVQMVCSVKKENIPIDDAVLEVVE